MQNKADKDLATEFDFRSLSTWFRRKYWRQNANEADASVLWPGLRRMLSLRLAGEKSIVVAATTRTCPAQVASRSVFTRSRLRQDLWYYGYLLTLPQFRRRGLGERVMQAGLAAIRRAGGRYCSCIVEYGNQASADLAEKLGLARLPLVRLVVRKLSCNEQDTRISLIPFNATDIQRYLAEDVYEGTSIDQQENDARKTIAADELNVPRSHLPWHSPESTLAGLRLGDQTVGVARIGPHKSVIVPGTAHLAGDAQNLIDAMVAALYQDGRPVFVFAPPAVCREFAARHANCGDISCKLFDIFWGDFGSDPVSSRK